MLAETQLAGEVILLKGSTKVDRMERVALDYERQVDCWIDDCARPNTCFACEKLCGDASRSPGKPEGRLVCAADAFAADVVRLPPA